MCLCVSVCSDGLGARSESISNVFERSPCLSLFLKQAFDSPSCGQRGNIKNDARVPPPVFLYIQNSGYYPQFITTMSMEKSS